MSWRQQGAGSVRSFRGPTVGPSGSVAPSMTSASSRRSVKFKKVRGKKGLRRPVSAQRGPARSVAGSQRSVASARSNMTSVPKGNTITNRTMAITPSSAAKYWDAAYATIPPALSTTYGNFTCVNSVTRFTITPGSQLYGLLQFQFTPSPLRATALIGDGLTTSTFMAWQQAQLNASNTVPLDIRPLRMSVKIRCTTTNLDVGGSISALLVPQSISMFYTANSTVSAGQFNTLRGLVSSSPKAVILSNVQLAKHQSTFVCPPSSYVAYNSYKDWIPLGTGSDFGAALTATDFIALNPTLVTLPGTETDSWFGMVPTNSILLVNLDPNIKPQSYLVEVYCQDAVRFPANSLAASLELNAGNLAGHLSAEAASRSASLATQAFHSSGNLAMS